MKKLNEVNCDQYPGEYSTVLGWAVYSGSEGEDPTLEAFFVSKQNADRFAALADDDGEDLVFDATVTPAMIDSGGLTVANDCRCETPEQLMAAEVRIVDPEDWR